MDSTDRSIMFFIVFGVIGAVIAGPAGVIIGGILGVCLSRVRRHKHDWQNQTLYDANGKPAG
ncbi:unnamed protein product, partial [marine sediment metagenome]